MNSLGQLQTNRYEHYQVMHPAKNVVPLGYTQSLRNENMKLKCKECGTVRTKKEAYKGKYALASDDNIVVLSNMDNPD